VTPLACFWHDVHQSIHIVSMMNPEGLLNDALDGHRVEGTIRGIKLRKFEVRHLTRTHKQGNPALLWTDSDPNNWRLECERRLELLRNPRRFSRSWRV
jgi:hypothetical protein